LYENPKPLGALAFHLFSRIAPEGVFMKTLLCWCTCLVAWSTFPARAQTSDYAVVVVRVFDNGTSLTMDIARPEGTHERRQFKARDLPEKGAAAERTRQLIAQLYQEGYGLTSTYGGGDHINSTNTLVFTKRLRTRLFSPNNYEQQRNSGRTRMGGQGAPGAGRGTRLNYAQVFTKTVVAVAER
jgi:hypothetical protein